MNRRSSTIVAALIAVFAWLAPRPACAEQCSPRAPWVQVDFDAAIAGLREGALLELRAEMHRRGIAVCTEDDPREGAPRVFVRVSPIDLGVRIDAGIAEGQTEFSRDVALHEVPEDTRAFMVATRIDEALRSRWEHLLPISTPLDEGGQPRAVPSPTEVEAIAPTEERVEVAERETPTDASIDDAAVEVTADEVRVGVSIGARARAFYTGTIFVDAVVGLRVRPFGRYLEVEIGVEGGLAAPQTLDLGVVDAQRFAGYVMVAATPMAPPDRVQLFGYLRADAGAVWWVGHTDAQRSEGSSPHFALEGGAQLVLPITSALSLTVSGWIGGVAIASYVTDGVVHLTGIADFHGGGSIGVIVWP